MREGRIECQFVELSMAATNSPKHSKSRGATAWRSSGARQRQGRGKGSLSGGFYRVGGRLYPAARGGEPWRGMFPKITSHLPYSDGLAMEGGRAVRVIKGKGRGLVGLEKEIGVAKGKSRGEGKWRGRVDGRVGLRGSMAALGRVDGRVAGVVRVGLSHCSGRVAAGIRGRVELLPESRPRLPGSG